MRRDLTLNILLFVTAMVVSQTACRPPSPPTVSAQAQQVDRKCLRGYACDVTLPDDLLRAYNAFADAARRSDAGALEQWVLPNAVRIRRMMDRAITETPEDICLWRLGDDFAPDIMVVRKDAADLYLIRTASSATWWVKTESMGWRLYHYLDKQIE